MDQISMGFGPASPPLGPGTGTHGCHSHATQRDEVDNQTGCDRDGVEMTMRSICGNPIHSM
eukprot:6185212-Karenia_brevis.AAC.1